MLTQHSSFARPTGARSATTTDDHTAPGEQQRSAEGRVLHIVDAEVPGVGRHVLDLVRHQTADGWSVDVAYVPSGVERDFPDRLAGLEFGVKEVLRLEPGRRLRRSITVRTLRRFVRQHGHDIVHGHGLRGGTWSQLAAAGSPARTVHTPNPLADRWPDLGPTRRSAYRHLEVGLSPFSGELALSGSARVVNRANVPVNSTNAPPARNVALGVVVGAILGAALALARENLDRNIRDVDDVDAMGLLALGSFPKAKRRLETSLSTVEEPDGIQAEAAQKLQAAIQFLIASDKLESIVVTSPRQGDGKTTTAANLAVAMARAGKRTLLIDADLRRPRVHKMFGIPQSPGLTNVALDPAVLTAAAKTAASISESLVVVPAGELPPHPAGFIATSMFGTAIDDLESMADITIIDAAPVLPVADTLSLAAHADGVLMVARAGETTRDDLAEAAASIRNAGGTIIGTALIGVSAKDKSYYYYSAGDEPLDRMAPPHTNGSGPTPRTVTDETATASPN